MDSAAYSTSAGLFSFANVVVPDGSNQCINGDCSLPGKTAILNTGCQSSISTFAVDYGAPLQYHSAPDVRSLPLPLVQYADSANLVGGLNDTFSVSGNFIFDRNDTATSISRTARRTLVLVPVLQDFSKFLGLISIFEF